MDTLKKQLVRDTDARASVDCCNSMAERRSVRVVLEDSIKRKELELIELKALAKALPQELPHEADQALWRILMDARH